MNSNKKIDAYEILKFSDDNEKFDFEVATLHFDFMQEIQKLMEAHKMRSKDLAKAIGYTTSYISQLFAGDKLLNMKTLTKIQKVFSTRFRLSTIHEQQKVASPTIIQLTKTIEHKNLNILHPRGAARGTVKSSKDELIFII